jgi:hypothetical protein
MKNLLVYLIGVVSICAGMVIPASGGDKAKAVSDNDDINEVLKTFRSDVNATKIATLNQVMKLTAAEAEKFWPLYRAYEDEMSTLSERKIKVLRDFSTANSAGKLDNRTAEDIATRWLSGVDERVALWKKYYIQISQALSPIRGAQFLQVENQMALFIDLSIASEMPAIH